MRSVYLPAVKSTGQTNLNTHALEIVQGIDEASHIATMAHLSRIEVVLELCSVHVIIGGVTVDEAIHKKRVEWESPVRRGGMVGVVGPFSPVMCRICGGLVLVQVVLQEICVVRPTCRGCRKERDQPAGEQPLHGEGWAPSGVSLKASRSLKCKSADLTCHGVESVWGRSY